MFRTTILTAKTEKTWEMRWIRGCLLFVDCGLWKFGSFGVLTCLARYARNLMPVSRFPPLFWWLSPNLIWFSASTHAAGPVAAQTVKTFPVYLIKIPINADSRIRKVGNHSQEKLVWSFFHFIYLFFLAPLFIQLRMLVCECAKN
jgi:hypothetical protein